MNRHTYIAPSSASPGDGRASRLGLAALAWACLALGSGQAQAQAVAETRPALYGNVGFTEVSDVVEFGALTGRLGARVHPYLGIEGEASVGVYGTEVTGEIEFDGARLSFGVSTQLERAYGLYAVGFYPAAPNLDLFARAGLGRAEVEIDTQGFDAEAFSLQGDFYGLGLGAQYSFDGANGVRLEYTRLGLVDFRTNVGTFGLSYVRRF